MTKSELDAIRAKYSKRDSDSISFLTASDDVNAILDALPESPRNTLLRSKYADHKADHRVMFWLVEQDVNGLLDEVVTIEPVEFLGWTRGGLSIQETDILNIAKTTEVSTDPELPQVPKVDPDAEIETVAKNSV